MTESKQNQQIGGLIRRIRKSERLSLAEVAKRTDLSQSFLSQLERGMTNPSINTLRSIADALRCPLGVFFQSPSETEGPVVRKNERKVLFSTSSRITYELMSNDPNHKIQLLVTVLEPNSASVEKARAHRGDEAGLVVQGQGRFELDDQTYDLKEGDAIFIGEEDRVPGLDGHGGLIRPAPSAADLGGQVRAEERLTQLLDAGQDR